MPGLGSSTFGCVTLSWDDGDPLDLRLADLMAKHGLRGTFYVSRTFGSRPVLDAQAIRQLAGRFEVGAHTLTHVPLPVCTKKEAKQEIQGSKQWLEDLTSRLCRSFCFPYGAFGARELGLVAEAGFRNARIVTLLSTDWPTRRAGLWVMPTTLEAVVRRSTARYVGSMLKKGWIFRIPLALRVGRRSWPEMGRRLLDQVKTEGGVFHFWGHSRQVEDLSAWTVLEDFFRMLGDARDMLPVLTNAELCQRAAAQTATPCVRCEV